MCIFHTIYNVILNIHTINNEMTIYNYNSLQHSIVLMNTLRKTSACIYNVYKV